MNINRYINIIFYDIPVATQSYNKTYTKFRKYLLQNGYYQIQESVYACKMPNKEKAMIHKNTIKLLAPQGSTVRMLLCTRKQFQSMYILAGELSVYEQILLSDTLMIKI